MTLVLDSGGISMLAENRARLEALRRRDAWPPIVPTAVLTEALTGDHRRDFHADRLLRLCLLESLDEDLARAAALLRTAAGAEPGVVASPSAVDAIVAAHADRPGGATVLTGDAHDLQALARHTRHPVRISTG
ncbi:MAG: hypothetical protein QOE93_268 [Actinomycetota bacterium]|nr:hypothetical protein [Actinomycetota bacterium]